ncbi:hypothetical protein FACS1894139_14770 [Planctomycetales bacterium]|nr:hypothetical protein FACS1894108_14450 [Planctomycetales bacterium]GHT07153.1 hypothetical protein FACS1894139_14770 [Planctomycetales bacterium]
MRKKIIYTDAPPDVEEALRDAKIIDDFLPPPEIMRTYGVRVFREIAPGVEVDVEYIDPSGRHYPNKSRYLAANRRAVKTSALAVN